MCIITRKNQMGKGLRGAHVGVLSSGLGRFGRKPGEKGEKGAVGPISFYDPKSNAKMIVDPSGPKGDTGENGPRGKRGRAGKASREGGPGKSNF